MRSEMDGLVGRSLASPLPTATTIVPPTAPWASVVGEVATLYCHPASLDGAMAGNWLHGPCQAVVLRH